MTNPDYRAMCAELADALAEWRLGGGPPEDTADAELVDRARALLAEPVIPVKQRIFPTPSQAAECGGPCYEGSYCPEVCDCGLYQPPAPAQPVAEGLTDEEPDAFAIVQMRLDDLAGDQELMLYRWPNGEWSIDHTNPTSSVQLGEVSGKYGSTGRTLEEAVCKLAELLPTPEATDD